MFPRENRFFSPIRGTNFNTNSFMRNFNWSSFLTNAGKTLNVINQAIPVFYQVKPVLNNFRTMFKIAKEVRKPDDTIVNKVSNDDKELKNPIFFS